MWAFIGLLKIKRIKLKFELKSLFKFRAILFECLRAKVSFISFEPHNLGDIAP